MSHTIIDTARDTYSIDNWSEGYFDIDSRGLLDVGTGDHRIPLQEIVAAAQDSGMRTPVLLRFVDILRDRVGKLSSAFARAMDTLDYQGQYTAVYPIKVNQQRRVVEEIYNGGVPDPRCGVGLEAGSKPELMAVLALSRGNSVIVCNGYKDREFVRLALIGEKMGRRVYIVVEKMSELQLVLDEAKAMQVQPRIGLRTRLSSIGKGNWQNTGGEKSKFGLSATQILQVIDTLRQHNALDRLQLLHFHLGSQISNIRDIQRGMKEAARYYSALRQSGCQVQVVDVGGGLGVDYEGTRSRSYCSMNYSMEEYAYNILLALKEVSQRDDLPLPNVISESGRALTAHHAVLVSNVIGVESPAAKQPQEPDAESPLVLQELARCYHEIEGAKRSRSLSELYHEVLYRLGEAQDMYTHGVLSLNDKAQAEEIYGAACQALRGKLDLNSRAHQDILNELNEKLADKVFLNFSLFQSIPDAWGIDQVFPVLPLAGLDRPLTRRGVVQDITCDSDGRIDQYVDTHDLASSLPLPEWDEQRGMSLAIFMVGAYQEILGDMHNLFGDTDAVDVSLDGKGGFSFINTLKGDTVDHILRYVQFDTMLLQQQIHEQLVLTDLSRAEQAAFLKELREGLTGYTYLE
ncbi:MAG: biosynthetic arginine decarboxylase [Pseudomonadota bacterium]|nr:biosynthetic arginine decarboxylase [Pseudomonadota bacterium]